MLRSRHGNTCTAEQTALSTNQLVWIILVSVDPSWIQDIVTHENPPVSRGVRWRCECVRDTQPLSANAGTTIRGSTRPPCGNSNHVSTRLGSELSVLGRTTGIVSLSVGVVQGQVDSVFELLLSCQQGQATGRCNLVTRPSRHADGRRSLDVPADRSSGTLFGVGDVLGVCVCESSGGVHSRSGREFADLRFFPPSRYLHCSRSSHESIWLKRIARIGVYVG